MRVFSHIFLARSWIVMFPATPVQFKTTFVIFRLPSRAYLGKVSCMIGSLESAHTANFVHVANHRVIPAATPPSTVILTALQRILRRGCIHTVGRSVGRMGGGYLLLPQL